MRIILAIACLIAAATPGAAAAQSRLNLSFAPNAPETAPSADHARPLAMPVVEYPAPDGRLAIRRGIVAGFALTPGMSFGLGIFEGAPKRRIGAVDPAKPERASKRAAVGLSLKF